MINSSILISLFFSKIQAKFKKSFFQSFKYLFFGAGRKKLSSRDGHCHDRIPELSSDDLGETQSITAQIKKNPTHFLTLFKQNYNPGFRKSMYGN